MSRLRGSIRGWEGQTKPRDLLFLFQAPRWVDQRIYRAIIAIESIVVGIGSDIRSTGDIRNAVVDSDKTRDDNRSDPVVPYLSVQSIANQTAFPLV